MPAFSPAITFTPHTHVAARSEHIPFFSSPLYVKPSRMRYVKNNNLVKINIDGELAYLVITLATQT